jgi:YVTN family beta-propeller protein
MAQKRQMGLGGVGVVAVLVLLAVAAGSRAADPVQSGRATPYSPTGRYANGALLPNGRLVTPAGAVVPLGDFPVAVAVAPGGGMAVVCNAGQGEGSNQQQGNQSLQVVDLGSNEVVQTLTDHAPGKDVFYNEGLAFSPDGGKLFVTGGGNDAVYRYAVAADHLSLEATWTSTRKAKVPQLPEAADLNGYSRNLAVSPDGTRVYVTNEQGASVAALDASTGSIAWETQLPLGAYPAGIALSPDGHTAYVATQGSNALLSFDVSTGALRSSTLVGDHPVAVAVTHDGSYAFVANDNDDSVAMVSLTSTVPTVARRLSTHLFAGEANGSSPNALAIDESHHLVYVTNAGDDAVAVLGASMAGAVGAVAWSPAALRVLGFVPTAWYPTGVAVVPGDGSVVAVSAKGYGGVPVTNRYEYDGNDMVGLLTHVPRPTAGEMGRGRSKAIADMWFAAQANARRPADSPIPATPAGAAESPIKHVVLVVRENRTFDQVFGDLRELGRPNADADPEYLEFGRTDSQGRTITPNAHDIANRFAISDNFYSDGEASVQGHFWTALGTSTDYIEKSWLDYYSNRNHPYDPSLPVSYPRCGSIFQRLALAGKTFRNFGELEGLTTTQSPAPPAPGAACAVPGGAGDAVSLANEDTTAGNNLTLTTIKDTFRLAEMEKAYAPLSAADRVPDFTYVLMGNDHTGGSGLGTTTPQAQVATNDLAVGGLIDYLSHTPQWSSTAVFVMEDDSQDGLDHRDGHRNILLVASPYARPGMIGHLHISQASALHTIELLLGLPPLSTYTQAAPVPYELFTSTPDLQPYTAETPTYPLDATNPVPVYGTPAAVPVDVSQVDMAGPALEAQLWWATNPGRPMPETLIGELAARGGIAPQALQAWAAGRPCTCPPLDAGLRFAPGFGDPDG